jgi:ADP-ribosylation factor-like protein 5B
MQGGQDKLRDTWSTYYTGANAVILVVDSTDKSRLSTVKFELDKLLQAESLNGTPLLVFCNKQDINGALLAASIAEHLGLTQSLGDREWKIQDCSAITGTGLNAGIACVCSLFRRHGLDSTKINLNT